jgi:hypothetical protein
MPDIEISHHHATTGVLYNFRGTYEVRDDTGVAAWGELRQGGETWAYRARLLLVPLGGAQDQAPLLVKTAVHDFIDSDRFLSE